MQISNLNGQTEVTLPNGTSFIITNGFGSLYITVPLPSDDPRGTHNSIMLTSGEVAKLREFLRIMDEHPV
jgi:hypothetical protein